MEAKFNLGRDLLKSSVGGWWGGQEIKFKSMEIKRHGRVFERVT